MKPTTRLVPLLAAIGLAAGLAGCAATSAKGGEHDHAAAGSTDTQAHCEKHRKMMSGKPSAEQHAMMQEHMKSMTPEMRQRMQAMHEQCR
jgi:hypothetical protein